MVTQTRATQVAQWLADAVPFEFIDVRTPWEYELARVPGATLLTQEGVDRLATLDRQTRLVVLCHHGIRSQSAAQYFENMGFTDVHNLVGGIDAWGHEVDPTVGQY